MQTEHGGVNACPLGWTSVIFTLVEKPRTALRERVKLNL